jgi:predicted O-linked N-acetylglucosamine transferase (SPINDLY family)
MNLQRARALYESGSLVEAQALYAEVLGTDPRQFESLHLLGVIAMRLGEPARAVEWIGRAISVEPGKAAAYCNRGLALERLGMHEAAMADYAMAITLDPRFWGGYFNRAKLQRALGRLEDALTSYDAVIERNARCTEAWNNRGEVLLTLRRWEAALESSDRAIALAAQCAEAHHNRGLALGALERWQSALASHEAAIALRPDLAGAHRARATVLLALERPEAAAASYERAIALEPQDADALCNLGAALLKLGRSDAASERFDAAIEIDPANLAAHFNRGRLLQDRQQWQAALEGYDRVLSIEPEYAAAHLNRGVVLEGLGRWPDALASYDRVIALDGSLAEAEFNRGNVLERLRQPQAALESYDRAMSTKPALEFLRGQRRHTKMQLCDWEGFESDLTELVAQVERGAPACPPFAFLALSGSAVLHRRVAEIWARERCLSGGPLPATAAATATAAAAATATDTATAIATATATTTRGRSERIRVGYFSADFHHHPVAALTAELFETHDRRHFEIIAFAFGPNKQDAMRKRLQLAFDQFIEVQHQSDSAIALRARRRQLDIAVDLGGYTRNSRPGIFAARAAPIQVNFLGYPGTLAAPFMDYLVADRTLIPPAQRPHHAEKVLFLPSYQPNDSTRRIAGGPAEREAHGLPATGFVYCCFNNSFKITPRVFDVWMRILKRVPASVLWMRSAGLNAIANLRREAVARGIGPQRLLFAQRLEAMEDHLARYRLADLFLDTWPYGAHTTAGDALWAGLPLLTCAGEGLAGRVGASVLASIGLPELITTNVQEYESLAVALAADGGRLGEFTRRLAERRLVAPLFDIRSYTKNLEAGYAAMRERHRAGLPPADIHIEAACAADTSRRCGDQDRHFER